MYNHHLIILEKQLMGLDATYLLKIQQLGHCMLEQHILLTMIRNLNKHLVLLNNSI